MAVTRTMREMAMNALERSYISSKTWDLGIRAPASGPEGHDDYVIDYFIVPQTLTMVVRNRLPGFVLQAGFANPQTANVKSIDEITFDEAAKELRLIKHLPQ